MTVPGICYHKSTNINEQADRPNYDVGRTFFHTPI